MTTYYAAIKWPVDATRADISRTIQNDLELLVLALVDKGFDFERVCEYFEEACESVAADLPAASPSDGGEQ